MNYQMKRYVLGSFCAAILMMGTNAAAQSREQSAIATGEPVTAVATEVPTCAAKLTLGGRVLSANSIGLHGVWVTLEGDSLAEPKRILTDSFGNFSFDGVVPGEAYILQVETGPYRFNGQSRLIVLAGDLKDLRFVTEF
jgi:hypothetical protein